MATKGQRTYSAVDAHEGKTKLRITVDDEVGIEFWIGEQKGRDYGRRALLGRAEADDLLKWLRGLETRKEK